jgi:hypothetical protein
MKGFRLIIQVWTRLAWVVSCWDEWTGDSTISTRIAGKQSLLWIRIRSDPDLFALASGIINPDPDLDLDKK